MQKPCVGSLSYVLACACGYGSIPLLHDSCNCVVVVFNFDMK